MITQTLKIFLPILLLCGGGNMNVVALNTQGTIANANAIVQCIDGVWSAMGTGFDGGGTAVFDIAVGPDGAVYAGGSFHTADGSTVNHIAKWNGTAWGGMGAGTVGVNDTVGCMAFGPDGKLYVGGPFTTAGTVAAKRVAVWDGTNWAAVGEGFYSDYTNALVFDSGGTLYAGGVWTQLGGGSTVNHIAKWNGSAWSALGGTVNNSVWSLAIDSSDNLYAGGDFTLGGTIPLYGVGEWNGSAWSALGSGTASLPITPLTFASDGRLYAGASSGGTIGGIAVNNVGVWNGSAWSALGSGLGVAPNALKWYQGKLYAGGNWRYVPDLPFADSVAVWNGTTWDALDIDLPGTAQVFAIGGDEHRLFLGSDTAGTAYTSGGATTAVANTGSATAYPTIVFKRAGGTTATLESIQNLTTGDRLLFNYALADGEEIVINCTPATKTVTSTFIGNAIGKLLPNSNFATFGLRPGVNNIAVFISTTGSPTITANMTWPQHYTSADGS